MKPLALDAVSPLPSYREDKIDLNNALATLTLVPANKAEKAEGNDVMHHIMNKALNRNEPGHPAVSTNTMKTMPLHELNTA